MRGPRPTPLILTERQRAVLERITRCQTNPQRLVRRAALILALSSTPSNEQVARDLAIDRGTARIWRGRWLEAAERLLASETAHPAEQQLHVCIQDVLADAPRPGAPDTFTAEQIVQIVELACTRPQESARPTNYWLARELVDEAIKRQIVTTISPRTVQRCLKSGRCTTTSFTLLAEHQGAGPSCVCTSKRSDL